MPIWSSIEGDFSEFSSLRFSLNSSPFLLIFDCLKPYHCRQEDWVTLRSNRSNSVHDPQISNPCIFYILRIGENWDQIRAPEHLSFRLVYSLFIFHKVWSDQSGGPDRRRWPELGLRWCVGVSKTIRSWSHVLILAICFDYQPCDAFDSSVWYTLACGHQICHLN